MDGDPWAEYARLQAMLERTADAYKAAGIEAAMVDLLDKIDRGQNCERKQVDNLIVNRIGRERRRRAIVYAGRHDIGLDCSADGGVEARLMLQACAKSCSIRDFSLLVLQAKGHTYGEIANATSINSNTLKTWAHRAKTKLEALAA